MDLSEYLDPGDRATTTQQSLPFYSNNPAGVKPGASGASWEEENGSIGRTSEGEDPGKQLNEATLTAWTGLPAELVVSLSLLSSAEAHALVQL